MSKRIVCLRHGQTLWNVEHRFQGHSDIPLDQTGIAQAARAASLLASLRPTAIVSSDLRRANDTALSLGRIVGLEVSVDKDFRERGGGLWEGLTREEIAARWPEEYVAWEADPFTFAPEGGESGLAVLARALPVIRELVTAHPDCSIIVVSHKATIRLLLASLLGFDARGYRDRLDQAPAALTILDFKDHVRARLMLFNDVSHYSREVRQPDGNLSRWWDQKKPQR